MVLSVFGNSDHQEMEHESLFFIIPIFIGLFLWLGLDQSDSILNLTTVVTERFSDFQDSARGLTVHLGA